MATPASAHQADLMEEFHVEEVETVRMWKNGDEGCGHHRVKFNGIARSERSSRVSRSEMGRSVARVYEPSLQERAQHFLEGPSGLYLELVNLACSCIIFALYIVELYHPSLAGVAVKRAIEVGLTSFFVFDLGLHIFVAPYPFEYLLSVYGVIDVITIIPSFLMYFATSTKSQTFFILRVLRIFRALRVLRLKRFIRFKRHGFNYELSVFILSAVAVILCASGMFHAMEEAYYLDRGENFHFHQALYFILVTISTVGYGDISPQTSLGQIFVMLLIIAVFTIVPQQATKLNTLAKQNHQYDKDYTQKNSKRPGHVIVSGHDISVDSISDFLDEFYHVSRGNIQMDVVFMCETPPSPAILRLLSRDRFLQRTTYLRGSLSNGNDQRRARLGEATAVFFLANKLIRRESVQQDSRTVLHTLAVRNFADSSGIHLDIHVQLGSREQELEVTAQLLGSTATNTSDLQTMILSRSALCPGASTLILNLLHSVSAPEYATSHQNTKGWIEEYVDGMSYQAFPIIFSKRFQYEKYDDVVHNIYEHYNSLVIMVRPRRRSRPSMGGCSVDADFRITPFQSVIREGDVGIVLAKTAATVLHIVNSYGFWNEENTSRSSFSPTRHVRVSTESLIKRRSPRSRLKSSKSALSLLEQSRSFNNSDSDTTKLSHLSRAESSVSEVGLFSNISGLGKADETSAPQPSREPLLELPVIRAVRRKDTQEVNRLLGKDHIIHDARHFQDHFVVCGGRLRDALSIAAFIRRFCRGESKPQSVSPQPPLPGALTRFSDTPAFVVMMEQHPSAQNLIKVLAAKEDNGENIETMLDNVMFISGSSSRAGDLRKAGIERATRVLVLPEPSTTSKLKLNFNTPHKMTSSSDAQTLSHENMTDFGVLNSLLIAEVVREDIAMGFGGDLPPRRRHSSRQQHHPQSGDSTDNSLAFYRRELEQGLPLESIKVRMLERFPDLKPTMFNQLPEAITTSLHHYDSDSSVIERSRDSDVGASDAHQRETLLDEINTIALLHHASSAKFCRPRDPAVNQDEFPCLAPSFAGGDVMLSSVLDRIVCQSFYNPYITDFVRALACGEGELPASSTNVPKSATTPRPRRLFQVAIDDSHVGADFVSVFQDLLALKMLVIGILRSPNPTLENLRPFVLTCPPPDTTIHVHDKLFVLG